MSHLPRTWRLFDWFVLCGLLGMALAIVLPNFQKARVLHHPPSCIAQLKWIDGAVSQWAAENRKTPADIYSLADPQVLAYLRGNVLPKCPNGGVYSAGTNVSDLPKCSLPGHTL